MGFGCVIPRAGRTQRAPQKITAGKGTRAPENGLRAGQVSRGRASFTSFASFAALIASFASLPQPYFA
eukprot:1819854-Prymnesium_polylepis.1